MADEPLSSDPNPERRPDDGSGHDLPVPHETDHHAFDQPAPHDPVPEIDQPARYLQPAEPTPEEEEEGGPVKSFLEHLEDLRWVLIKVIASILVAMTICMCAAPTIVKFLSGRRLKPTLVAGSN